MRLQLKIRYEKGEIDYNNGFLNVFKTMCEKNKQEIYYKDWSFT